MITVNKNELDFRRQVPPVVTAATSTNPREKERRRKNGAEENPREF